MIRTILFLLFILFQVSVHAQEPSLLSIDQLEKRIESGQDTVYIINFWATWCAPCVHELPAFEKFNTKIRNKGKSKSIVGKCRQFIDPRIHGTAIRHQTKVKKRSLSFKRERSASIYR
jgi:thiol-disulfide isomerase/thioredoxin